MPKPFARRMVENCPQRVEGRLTLTYIRLEMMALPWVILELLAQTLQAFLLDTGIGRVILEAGASGASTSAAVT